MNKFLFTTCVGTLMLLNAFSQTDNYLAVQTTVENGVIEGKYDTKSGMQLYLGIPFAKPPVGPLRWKAPQPLSNWQGVKARNGTLFERTTDHEKKFKEDAAIIASVAPNYRMGLMWSKLQRAPLAPFDLQTSQEYHRFLQDLKGKGIGIMMVLHHFTNPLWFSRLGGWEKTDNIPLWVGRHAADLIRE